MKIIDGFFVEPRLERPTVLTFGKFDALHRGHQAIFRRAIDRARATGREAAVLFLHPHPLRLLNPEACPPSLTTLSKKIAFLESFGFDLAIIGRFDERLRTLPADAFLDRLVHAFRAEAIVVGYHVRFGHRGTGDTEMLRRRAEALGYEIEALPPIEIDGEPVSSTRVREAIAAGDLERARRLLGRRYSVTGPVVEGDRRGHTLGFPTANVDTGDLQLPPCGVYAAYTVVGDRVYGSAVNLGVRPTFAGVETRLESHLLDYSGDLYGKEIEVVFVEKIRDEIRFPNVEALMRQMKEDVTRARAILDATPFDPSVEAAQTDGKSSRRSTSSTDASTR